jgi:teichuronic acid biosynthesis glycosyltransferase TuaC
VRILIISHMYPSTFNEVAGIFVHEQVKEIVGQGHEARVVSPVPWSPLPIRWMKEKWKRYAHIPQKTIWDGIEVYYPRYIALPRGLYFEHSGALVYNAIKKTVQQIYKEFPFDIIHAHVAMPDGYAAVKLKEQYEVPVVVTIHGQDLQVTIKSNEKCRESLNFVFERTDKLILVSTKLKRLMPTDQHNKKISVIGNGVPESKIFAGRKHVKPNYRKGSTITLLSVSNLINTKGIDLNIRAVRQLVNKYSNLLYVIVGEGDQRPILENMVSDLGLTEHVVFTGRLPHQEVLDRMADANIFCLPSWNEAFGVVYIEAMAQGVPVIACKGEGIEDVIEHGVNGMLIEPHDVASITKTIDYLLNNPEKAKEIGQRGSESVLDKYTWARNAEMNLKVYEELLH